MAGLSLSCGPCKAKRRKCTPKLPACEECTSTGGVAACDYQEIATLPPAHKGRGEACIPCRKKKKRCDGERPVCHVCLGLGKEQQCAYGVVSVAKLQEENRVYKDKIRDLERIIALTQSIDSSSSSSLSTTSSLSSGPNSLSNTTGRPGSVHALVAPTRDSSYTNDSVGLLTETTTTATSVVQQAHLSLPDEIPPYTAYGHMSIAAQAKHLAIPYYKPIEFPNGSLQDLPEETHPGDKTFAHPHPSPTQTSGPTNAFISPRISEPITTVTLPVFPAATDQLTFARHHVFANGLTLGLRFTSAKTQALMHGDLSDTIIGSACVHASTLWGLALIARAQGEVPDDALQATYHSAAHASLQNPPTTRDLVVDGIQARVVLAIYDFNRQNLVAGNRWLHEAVWCIRQAGLRFTLPDQTSGIRNDWTLYIAPTAQDQERDALCYLVSVDLGNRMITNAKSSFEDDMQQSVAQLLSYCDRHPDHASIIVLRLMAITLLFEIPIAYRGRANNSAFDLSIIMYIKRARRLLAHLEGPIILLSGQEHAHAALFVLQECVIIAQSVLVMSYLALARHGHPEGKHRCISAMAEVASVMKTMTQEDISKLNPFVMYCWSFVLDVILQERSGRGWLEGALPSEAKLLEMETALERANPRSSIRSPGTNRRIVSDWMSRLIYQGASALAALTHT